VAVHGIRQRKTGPGHGLVVVVCRVHGRHYTLYPPGYVPYGRMPVAPVDHDGTSSLSTWKRTVFVAAVVAVVAGVAWPREGGGGPCFRTQRRQIERAAQWLGLRSPRAEAEAVAYHLDVGVMDHLAARSAYERARGWLLRSGHQVGVCGESWWWRPSRGYLPSFRPVEQAASAGD
jgi:hypothetical protein